MRCAASTPMAPRRAPTESRSSDCSGTSSISCGSWCSPSSTWFEEEPMALDPVRKKYLKVFFVLAVLTAIEIGVATVLKQQRGLMIALLVGLAGTKAAAVALYFMHLGDERRGLKLAV